MNTKAFEWKLARDLAGEHIQSMIRNPDPASGWQGDPWLSVYLNKLFDRWEIVDEKPGPSHGTVVASADATADPDIRKLILWLRDHDHRNPLHTTMEDVITHNEKLMASREKEAVEALSDKLEKVYWGIGKDVGQHY